MLVRPSWTTTAHGTSMVRGRGYQLRTYSSLQGDWVLRKCNICSTLLLTKVLSRRGAYMTKQWRGSTTTAIELRRYIVHEVSKMLMIVYVSLWYRSFFKFSIADDSMKNGFLPQRHDAIKNKPDRHTRGVFSNLRASLCNEGWVSPVPQFMS